VAIEGIDHHNVSITGTVNAQVSLLDGSTKCLKFLARGGRGGHGGCGGRYVIVKGSVNIVL